MPSDAHKTMPHTRRVYTVNMGVIDQKTVTKATKYTCMAWCSLRDKNVEAYRARTTWYIVETGTAYKEPLSWSAKVHV